MSEPRKNHLSIDGGLVKDDEHVASYKPIPESDTDFRTSKSSLAKSKEKVSSDGAEEKLLAKEDEAKITTRVDMADAKYVVGDHRNGDAKIELDANKRQFTGLTKEELMKYADDPFWVRLRWFMFILFWALWLCMLAGAIAIIVRAPKCYPPPPRTWYEKGPLVDLSSVKDYSIAESNFKLLEKSKVAGIFASSCEETYEVLEDPTCLDKFKDFVTKAKAVGVKVIVDLTANFVSVNHTWFQKSKNKSLEYDNFFIWQPLTSYEEGEDGKSVPKKPAQGMNALGDSVVTWQLDEQRGEFYMKQSGENRAALNMTNPEVVKQFDGVLKKWMEAGAAGVRLQHAHELVMTKSMQSMKISQQQYPGDLPELAGLLAHWSHLVAVSGSAAGLEETVFTLAEAEGRAELYHAALRPPSLAPVRLTDARADAAALNKRLANWPALQLVSDDPGDQELASFALLLPAAPVLDVRQLDRSDNDTEDDSLTELIGKRDDASIEHGTWHVASVPAGNTTDELLACVRWKVGHTGYVAVYNPLAEEARANLTALPSLPADLSVYRVSKDVKAYTNYTKNIGVRSEDVLVPPKSSIVLLYVPKTPVEK